MKVVDFVGVMGHQCRQVSAALWPAFDIGFTQCQHIGGWLLATRADFEIATGAFGKHWFRLRRNVSATPTASGVSRYPSWSPS